MTLEYYIFLYLWIGPHLLLPVIAALMYRRGQHKAFPIFFSYLFFQFLKTCVLFSIYWMKAPPIVYREAHLIGLSVGMAFQFGILQEIFAAPAAGGTSLRRGMAGKLNWIAAGLVFVGTFFIAAFYYSKFDHPMVHTYLVSESISAAQCALIVLAFLWYRFLGLRMSPLAFGIAVGMGLETGADPLLVILKNSVSPASYRSVDILQMAIYHVAVLIWVYYAWVREEVPVDSNPALSQLIEQVPELERIVRP